eukprot:440224-Pyramimonas_sp.AAC.1
MVENSELRTRARGGGHSLIPRGRLGARKHCEHTRYSCIRVAAPTSVLEALWRPHGGPNEWAVMSVF